MIRLILLGIFFVLLTNKRQLDAARELYGQSSGRIRTSNLNIDQMRAQLNLGKDYTKKLSKKRDISSSFMQSRRFHPDQLARDIRDLGQPSTFTTPISSSYYYYSYGGSSANLAISSQTGCRLTNNFCSRDYQCCSGKCRCVKWTVMGKMSCWKKCF